MYINSLIHCNITSFTDIMDTNEFANETPNVETVMRYSRSKEERPCVGEFTYETPHVVSPGIPQFASSKIEPPPVESSRIKKHSTNPLSIEYDSRNKWEIGIDEAGRGPMFGRLYVAGVILPKCNPSNVSVDTSVLRDSQSKEERPCVGEFRYSRSKEEQRPCVGEFRYSRSKEEQRPCVGEFRYQDMKDSKKFHSSKKIKEVSAYIKQHALAWHIHYIPEQTIDQINIRQSVLRAMQECAKQCIYKLQLDNAEMVPEKDVFLLIDGNDFVSCPMFDESRQSIIEIPHKTFEGGDNTFCAIAAASILAKVARDEYIEQLCIEYPELDVRYGILKNKGYGTKTHLDGIRTHGICEWHRRSYGICKTERMNPITPDYRDAFLPSANTAHD